MQYSYITTHRFIFTPEGRELGGRFETGIFDDLAGWLDGMGVISLAKSSCGIIVYADVLRCL